MKLTGFFTVIWRLYVLVVAAYFYIIVQYFFVYTCKIQILNINRNITIWYYHYMFILFWPLGVVITLLTTYSAAKFYLATVNIENTFV